MCPAITFDGVESKSFDPLPKGRYLSQVSALEYIAESKRSGEPTLAWEFTVMGGEFDKRKGFLNTSLQQQSLWNTMRILTALGYSEDEVKSREWDFEDPEIVEELIGRDCVIVVRHEKYEGEDKQRISRVISADNLSGVANAEGAVGGI
jgi:hypothetical protein